MAVKIGDVTIRIGASTKQLEADLRKAERSLQATADKFTNIGQNLTLGVTAPVLAAGAAAFKMASDYEESLNKVRVAFGGSSESVEQFAKTSLTSFGIAEQSALEMAGTFGNFATSMGFTQTEAAKLSTELVGLAGDMASFNNVPLDQVQTALSSIFTGEAEPLKRFGVNMQESTLAAFALEKGIKKSYKAMSDAEKIAIRYQFVLDKTKNAQGDFARTSDGAANQTRIFQESLKEVASRFGKDLLPVITPVIQRLNQLLKSFSELDNATKKTIITVAALAAAVGPVVIAYGQLTKAYGAIQVGATRIIGVWIEQAAAAAKAAGEIPKLTASTVTFGTTIRATLTFLAPYAAAIAAIGAAIYLVYQNYKRQEEVQDSVESLRKEEINSIGQQKSVTDRLIATINNENASKQEKEKALKRLQEISPEYFKGLTIEKDGIDKINVAYTGYLEQLRNVARQKVAQSKIDAIEAERFELEQKRIQASGSFQDALSRQGKLQESLKNSAKESSAIALETAASNVVAAENEIKAINAQLRALDERQKSVDQYAKTVVPESKTPITPIGGGATEGTKKFADEIKKLNQELLDVDKLLKAGLITGAEAAEKEIGLLQKKLETLVLSGLSPTSSAVLSVKERLSDLSTGGIKVVGDLNSVADYTNYVALELLKLENAFEIGLIDQSELSSQKISVLTKELQTLSDQGFAATSTEVQKLKAQLGELTGPTYNIKSQLPDTTTTDILIDLNKELAIIQDKTDAGLFGDLEADEQKLQSLKNSLSTLIEQGLGGTDLAKNIQGQIGQLTVPENSFKTLSKDLESKFQPIAEAAAQVATPLFATINQGLQNQSARLDEYYAKEKALIEGSTLTEEQKAEKLAQLDAKVAKERKKIARDQAKSAKAQALFDATINGTLAVIKALGQGGPILAAIVGGLVAAQIAAIAAQPLPSLAIGTDLVKRDGLAMIHKGEAIVPANVARGGFSGRAGGQLTGKLSGIDILISAENSRRYLNKVG